MFIVTTNDAPGYRVTAIVGEVVGVTVRSRHFGDQISAGFRSLGGGELPEMTRNLAEARAQATERMVVDAQARGANAILAARFDASDLGGTWTELCAYGTAVVVEPIGAGEAGATTQSSAHAAQATQAPPPA